MRQILNLLLDIIFPELCVSCGRPVVTAQRNICSGCAEKFEKISGGCPVCSGIISGGACSICGDRKFYPEAHISLFRYENTVKSAVHAMKFKSMRGIYAVFVPYVCDGINRIGRSIDLITSVPMNRRKLIKRGYNQSELIARGAGMMSGITYHRLLAENRNRTAQRNLNYNERFVNVIDRYKTVNNNKISGRSILLVDDVFTTGATINECSRVLLAAGASKVYALTVVRSDLKKLENV